MNTGTEPQRFRRVAVIDIGASSVRMQLAEIFPDGSVEKKGSYSQAVSLGRDSFSTGMISKATTEDCVNVLRVYREILEENRVDIANNVRVVATSGLNEASNRLAFQDRVSIATGFEIEPFDSAELHRVTYLGLYPLIEKHSEIFYGDMVVCEVGGGTTEFLFLNSHDILFCRTFRLGSLRLRGSVESVSASDGRVTAMLESRIDSSILQIQHLVHDQTAGYLAMGGDVRFAASLLNNQKQSEGIVTLSADKLDAFARSILDMESEHVASKFKLSLPESQMLGPALLIHATIARRFGAEFLHVAPSNLRDSLIRDMAGLPGLSSPIDNQIVRSAELLARKYDVDIAHSQQVAMLACSLFEQTESLHKLPARYRIVIHLAALLHDVGQFVNSRSHHKHAMYLILNSELFGVSRMDQQFIALVVRYHRRASPQPTHEIYNTLSRENRIAVAKLAALLRVAKALDASRMQKISQISIELVGRRLRIIAETRADLTAEQLDMRQDGKMFEDMYGLRLELVYQN